ncbi:MAG: hypothetical protein JRF49_06465 [Deltaproteobacteria bacterium]|nr:hypothetical protein [Deltaproteobacteria bacterium]MBW2183491.1 hypothetical protein [Deltaproteobacteria bacterium]
MIGKLYESCKNCQKVALTDSSRSFAEQVFNPLGFHLLSAIVVQDPYAVLRTVSEGKEMRSFKGYVRKINFNCKK